MGDTAHPIGKDEHDEPHTDTLKLGDAALHKGCYAKWANSPSSLHTTWSHSKAHHLPHIDLGHESTAHFYKYGNETGCAATCSRASRCTSSSRSGGCATSRPGCSAI